MLTARVCGRGGFVVLCKGVFMDVDVDVDGTL